MNKTKIDKANQLAMERILNSDPVLVDMQKAINVIPGMLPNQINHAGPAIAFEDMCGPQRGAVTGMAVLEGMAQTLAEAEAKIHNGQIILRPNHDHQTVGPMSGPVGPSTPVYVIKNFHTGNIAFTPIHEGLGKVLSMGANGPDVLEKLKWIAGVVAPVLSRSIQAIGGIHLKNLIAEGIMRGDEQHNRCKASTSMFVETLLPHMYQLDLPKATFLEIYDFLTGNPQTFATPAMGACKATMDAGSNIPYSTIVTAYSRNGSTVGVRLSGTGSEWFIHQAPMVQGLYMPGYSEQDAAGDLGDSAIVEIAGLGAFVMAASPAICQLLGGTAEDATSYTMKMYEITLGESLAYKIPSLNFRGGPIGVDVRKIIEKGILPLHNTAISHKEAGIGMIGAGIVESPMECYEQALLALAETLPEEN